MSNLVVHSEADRRLSVLHGAIDALARCTTLNEAKGIADKAAAAVVWARKAKLGLEAQNHAAEIKIRAERRAGEILADLERTPPEEKGRRAHGSTCDVARTDSPYANAIDRAGADRFSAARWQQVADIPEEKFEKHIAEAKAAGEEVTTHGLLKRAGGPHVAHNSLNNEWYTPGPLIEIARSVLGAIDLDPASSAIANETVKAKRFFAVEDNGLTKCWSGRVWMNPPYESGVVDEFASKLVEDLDQISAAITLTNNATETQWFQKMAQASSAICLLAGRVRFYRPDGSAGAPLQGQALLYFGTDSENFRAAFAPHGVVYGRLEPAAVRNG